MSSTEQYLPTQLINVFLDILKTAALIKKSLVPAQSPISNPSDVPIHDSSSSRISVEVSLDPEPVLFLVPSTDNLVPPVHNATPSLQPSSDPYKFTPEASKASWSPWRCQSDSRSLLWCKDDLWRPQGARCSACCHSSMPPALLWPAHTCSWRLHCRWCKLWSFWNSYRQKSRHPTRSNSRSCHFSLLTTPELKEQEDSLRGRQASPFLALSRSQARNSVWWWTLMLIWK